MTDDADELVTALESTYGDALYAVATYTREEYDVHYLAEATADAYTELDIEDIYDEVVLQGLEHDFHESLFHEMGDVRGQIRLFDAGIVAHFWPTDGDDGLLVAVDRDADVNVWKLYGHAEDYYG